MRELLRRIWPWFRWVALSWFVAALALFVIVVAEVDTRVGGEPLDEIAGFTLTALIAIAVVAFVVFQTLGRLLNLVRVGQAAGRYVSSPNSPVAVEHDVAPTGPVVDTRRGARLGLRRRTGIGRLRRTVGVIAMLLGVAGLASQVLELANPSVDPPERVTARIVELGEEAPGTTRAAEVEFPDGDGGTDRVTYPVPLDARPGDELSAYRTPSGDLVPRDRKRAERLGSLAWVTGVSLVLVLFGALEASASRVVLRRRVRQA